MSHVHQAKLKIARALHPHARVASNSGPKWGHPGTATGAPKYTRVRPQRVQCTTDATDRQRCWRGGSLHHERFQPCIFIKMRAVAARHGEPLFLLPLFVSSAHHVPCNIFAAHRIPLVALPNASLRNSRPLVAWQQQCIRAAVIRGVESARSARTARASGAVRRRRRRRRHRGVKLKGFRVARAQSGYDRWGMFRFPVKLGPEGPKATKRAWRVRRHGLV
jgi:hypothetical protein